MKENEDGVAATAEAIAMIATMTEQNERGRRSTVARAVIKDDTSQAVDQAVESLIKNQAAMMIMMVGGAGRRGTSIIGLDLGTGREKVKFNPQL